MPISLSFLFIITGFIIALGAVTVIDLHGFLARTSSYWTVATTRTHKITKPLIWIGTILFAIGFLSVYEGSLLFIQSVVLTIMVFNGIFLSFKVSPYLLERERNGKDDVLLPKRWQTYITISFIISFISWWGSVILFTFYFL